MVVHTSKIRTYRRPPVIYQNWCSTQKKSSYYGNHTIQELWGKKVWQPPAECPTSWFYHQVAVSLNYTGEWLDSLLKCVLRESCIIDSADISFQNTKIAELFFFFLIQQKIPFSGPWKMFDFKHCLKLNGNWLSVPHFCWWLMDGQSPQCKF